MSKYQISSAIHSDVSSTHELKKTHFINLLIDRTPRVGDIVFAASDFNLTNPWKPGVVTQIINPFNLSVKFDDPFVNGGAVMTHRLIAYNKPTNNPIPVNDRVVGRHSS